MKTVTVDKKTNGIGINYTAENGNKYGYLLSYDSDDDTIWINGTGYSTYHRGGRSFDECVEFVKKLVSLPDTLTRDDYISACDLFAISALSDSDISSDERRYFNKYGDFDIFQISERLCQMRFNSIESESKPVESESIEPVEVGLVIADCGHRCSKNVIMSASMGTSCPNCYDRMSD